MRLVCTSEIFVEPLFGDAHEFGIAPDLKCAIGIAELLTQQKPCDIEDDGLQSEMFGVLAKIKGETFTNQRLYIRDNRRIVRRDAHAAIGCEDRLERHPLEHDAVAFDIGEADFVFRPLVNGPMRVTFGGGFGDFFSPCCAKVKGTPSTSAYSTGKWPVAGSIS